jgi:hypothetical protein
MARIVRLVNYIAAMIICGLGIAGIIRMDKASWSDPPQFIVFCFGGTFLCILLLMVCNAVVVDVHDWWRDKR